jgi:membrane protease YdiL (CAAX protease family)
MTLRSFAERHPLGTFTLLAYTVSWSFWLAWAAVEGPPLLRTVLFVFGGFGPFAAGAVTTRLHGERLGPWLRDIFSIRVRPRYYLIAVALPLVALGVAGLVHWGLLGGTPTPALLPAVASYPVFFGVVLLFGGGLEEPGWRGALLPRLQERHDSLTAALFVGVVWAAWHAPLFVLPGAVQNDIAPWLYPVQVVAMSVVLTWLTNASRGSVVPAILLHAGGNSIVNYYPIGGAAGAVSITGYGLLASVVVVAAVVVTLAGGRSLGTAPETPPVAVDGGRR